MTLYVPINRINGIRALPFGSMTEACLWVIGNGGQALWRIEQTTST